MSEKVKGTIGKLKEIKIPFMRKSAQGFIKQVKNVNSAEEERILIANESASIRNDFGQSNTETLRDNLLKLIFIHLLGYPSYFGQMASIQMINMAGYEDKRVGYLAMSLFLHESSDLLLLTVNSIKNDVVNPNPLFSFVLFIGRYIAGLAITFCGNCCCDPLARDVFPELVPFLTHENPYIRKKVCLSMIKMISLVPDLIEDMVKSLPSLLVSNDHGVLISGRAILLVTSSDSADDPHASTGSCISVQVPQIGSQSCQTLAHCDHWEREGGLHGRIGSRSVCAGEDAATAVFAV